VEEIRGMCSMWQGEGKGKKVGLGEPVGPATEEERAGKDLQARPSGYLPVYLGSPAQTTTSAVTQETRDGFHSAVHFEGDVDNIE
jgi:hypothetical protein